VADIDRLEPALERLIEEIRAVRREVAAAVEEFDATAVWPPPRPDLRVVVGGLDDGGG